MYIQRWFLYDFHSTNNIPQLVHMGLAVYCCVARQCTHFYGIFQQKWINERKKERKKKRWNKIYEVSVFIYTHCIHVCVVLCRFPLLLQVSRHCRHITKYKIVTYSRVELYNKQRVATLFGCGKTTLSEFTFEFVNEIKHDWPAVSFIFNDSILMIKRLLAEVFLFRVYLEFQVFNVVWQPFV